MTIHNEKEKGKEKLDENNANQMRFEKKLKIIKLNLNQTQNKSQRNKFMSKIRPNITNVSIQNKTSRQITNHAST